MLRIFSRNFLRKQFVRLVRWAEYHMLGLLFVFALVVGGLIVLWPKIFIKIPAGSVGVIYRPLSGGVDLAHLYREGFFLILPWNELSVYSTRVQLKELSLDLLTADLLLTKVKVGFQYELNPLTVPMLHKFVGPNYLNVLIIPQVVSVSRQQVAKFSSKMAYTEDVAAVANEIAITTDNVLIDKLSPPGLTNVRLVRVSSVQLLEVTFPQIVQAAIQDKVVQAENAEAYKFKIQAATQEAIRKKIEATGVRDFQILVNENMTQDYLIYRGIQATEQLAQSNNSKTLIFGSGPTGLPLLLGNALDNNPNPTSNSALDGSKQSMSPQSVESGPLETSSQMRSPLEPATSTTKPSMTKATVAPLQGVQMDGVSMRSPVSKAPSKQTSESESTSSATPTTSNATMTSTTKSTPGQSTGGQ
jgi:regulator of protease activity HflC (stomatin/prohibitin superfamily)